MNCWRTKAIIAGTSFGMLFTAIKDEIDIPDVLPEIIPSAWFDISTDTELRPSFRHHDAACAS